MALTIPRSLIPRFSLRAVFVLVTLVALWLGWHVYTVRQRQLARDQLSTDKADIWFNSPKEFRKRTQDFALHRGAHVVVHEADPAACPGWLRNLLGDQDVVFIGLKHLPTAVDLRLVSWFPEAVVTARDETMQREAPD